MPTRVESTKKSDNNITRFEIFPNAGGASCDVSQGVLELNYYENILSETVKLTATVIDTGNAAPADDGTGGKIGLDDALKVGNGEKVFISFEDGNRTPNKLSFTTDDKALYLNKKQKLSEHTQKTMYSIELVSKEFLINESTRVVKRYNGKISDSVDKILKEVVKTEKELDIEVTENKFNFIGTNKKPYWTILWLCKKSIPQKQGSVGKSAGYFFFENYDGFKFKSVDGLFDRIPIKKYIFNNSTSSVVPIGYDGKILKFQSSSGGDFQSNLMMGTYNSNNKGFNSKESSYRENPIDIDTQENGVTLAGLDYNFVNSIFTQDPSRISYSFDSVGFLPDGKDLQEQLKRSSDLDMDKSQIMNQAAMRYNQVFTLKLEITIPGDFDLRAGDLIFCDFPEQSSKPNQSTNKRLGGVYLISGLCHHITPNETYTYLELIRDSYGRKPIVR